MASPVLSLSSEKFATKLNTLVVKQTTGMVYDTNDSRIEFVQEHLGARGRPTYPQATVKVLTDKILSFKSYWIERYIAIGEKIDP